MSQVQYDVTYTESRNRITTLFRYFMSIPHFIVAALWAIAAYFAGLVQWFTIVFTGKRNEGIFNFQNQWAGYYARVSSYYDLMFDEYPKFGSDASGVPMTYSLAYEQPANRLTNGLRFLWAIPAWIIAAVLALAASVVVFVQWLIIVFTGKANRGMWDFTKKAINYMTQTIAYAMLMTDTYPKY